MLICRMVSEGWTNEAIAKQIGVVQHVVQNYMREIYDILGFSNRVEVAMWYIKYHGEQP